MRETIPTDLLLRLMSATPEQFAAVERVLGCGNLDSTNPVCGQVDVIHRVGRLAYRNDFADVWFGDEHFDLSGRAKARACLRYLVERGAFDATTACHFETEIDPYVRRQCQLPPQPCYGELKIQALLQFRTERRGPAGSGTDSFDRTKWAVFSMGSLRANRLTLFNLVKLLPVNIEQTEPFTFNLVTLRLLCLPGAMSAPMNDNPTNETENAITNPSDVMLTKAELAERLHVAIRTVENWQRRGILPFVKVGKIVLFHWPDVVEHLKSNFRVCRKTILKAGL